VELECNTAVLRRSHNTWRYRHVVAGKPINAWKPIRAIVYVLSVRFGEGSLIFSILYIFALLAFHRDDEHQFMTLAAVWLVIVPARLLENAADLVGDLKEIWIDTKTCGEVGELHARKEPNLLFLRQTGKGGLHFGQVITMPDVAAGGFCQNSLAFCDVHGEDVNGDGLPDLVCHFYSQRTGFRSGDSRAFLKGLTTDQGLIRGSEGIVTK
jgi:hypothetical protein